MVSVKTRMNLFRRRIASIRAGPGAYILPPELKRLHLTFANDGKNGNHGPRKFWRQHLPSLAYYNPDVTIEVARHQDTSLPALLTAHMTADAWSTEQATIEEEELEEDRVGEATHAIEIGDGIVSVPPVIAGSNDPLATSPPKEPTSKSNLDQMKNLDKENELEKTARADKVVTIDVKGLDERVIMKELVKALNARPADVPTSFTESYAGNLQALAESKAAIVTDEIEQLLAASPAR